MITSFQAYMKFIDWYIIINARLSYQKKKSVQYQFHPSNRSIEIKFILGDIIQTESDDPNQIFWLNQVTSDPNHLYHCHNKQLNHHDLITGILEYKKFSLTGQILICFFSPTGLIGTSHRFIHLSWVFMKEWQRFISQSELLTNWFNYKCYGFWMTFSTVTIVSLLIITHIDWCLVFIVRRLYVFSLHSMGIYGYVDFVYSKTWYSYFNSTIKAKDQQ